MIDIDKGKNIKELAPSEFYLGQNYPNPFKEKTVIKYCVAYKTRVQITVYSVEDKLIEKLVDEEKNPGTYEVEFSACYAHGSGNRNVEVFLYRIEAGEYKSEKKMLLLK
jgi:hypothetical protein